MSKRFLEILKIRVDNLSRGEIIKKVESFLLEPCFHQIATVNPEFILESQENMEFKKILNSCDLNVPDGAGIGFAFIRYGKFLKARMAGADLMMEILRIASEKNMKVFLACRKDGLSTWQETRDAINRIYPNIKVEGDDKGGIRDSEILFCNFGAPYQELFIKAQKNDTIRLAMGVGGSFDYLTKKIKRAPKFLRFLGLEWLWRLMKQPKRCRRIFRATIIFPLKIVFSK